MSDPGGFLDKDPEVLKHSTNAMIFLLEKGLYALGNKLWPRQHRMLKSSDVLGKTFVAFQLSEGASRYLS